LARILRGCLCDSYARGLNQSYLAKTEGILTVFEPLHPFCGCLHLVLGVLPHPLDQRGESAGHIDCPLDSCTIECELL